MTQKKDKVFEFIATCDTLSEHRELTADLMFTPLSLEYSGMEQLKRATFSSICPRSQQQISPKKEFTRENFNEQSPSDESVCRLHDSRGEWERKNLKKEIFHVI